MKKFIFLSITVILTLSASGQLAGKTICAYLEMIQDTGSLKFEQSKYIFYNQDRIFTRGEYSINGDTISLKDISGEIACLNGEIGKYILKIKKDGVAFTQVNEECMGRNIISMVNWIFVKEEE